MAAVPFGGSAEDAEEWVRSWSASVSQRAEQAQALADQVARLSVTAHDDDRLVTVTVVASGAMTDLRLGEQVHRWPADRIAATILSTMRRAQAALAGRVADIAAQTVGADTETGRAVVDSYSTRFPAEAPSVRPAPDSDGR